ncbi:hypothetical protein FB451DRAFT_1561409 [Mycena latifolia]|nr:hypothetical protein FB451DRAFT_1561409 [Mycena latifolia]
MTPAEYAILGILPLGGLSVATPASAVPCGAEGGVINNHDRIQNTNPSEAGPVAFISDDAEEITSVAHEIAAEVVALLGPGHTIPLTQALIEESLLESVSDPSDWLKAYTGRERYDCTEDNFYYTGVVIGPQAWQAPVELRRVERFSYDYDTWDTLVVEGGDGTEERTKAVTRYGGKGAPFFCWEGPYLYFKDWMQQACPAISRWDDATFIQKFFLLVDSDHGDCWHRRDLSGLPPCISYGGMENTHAMESFQELFVEARSGSANTAAAVAAGARARDLWPALARDFGAWMATRPDLWPAPPSAFPPLLPQSPLPPGAHTLFHSLPPEVLLQILPLLPLQDLCSLLLLSRSVPALFRPLLDETLWHHVHHGALYWVLPVPGVPGECRRAARVAKKWVSAAAGRRARGTAGLASRAFPWAQFLRACRTSDSMRNRRRLWGIAQGYRALWEARGFEV